MGSDYRNKESREMQMISLASAGLTDKQIANRLGLSLNTLEGYWRRILSKHGASSRTEVVAKAAATQAEAAFQKVIKEQLETLKRAEQSVRNSDSAKGRNRRPEASFQQPIDELTQVLEQLWRSRILLADLGSVLWWAKPEPPWTILWVSESIAQWGYEPSELVNRVSVCDLVEEKDRRAFEDGNRLATQQCSKSHRRSYVLKTRAGDLRFVQEHYMFLGPHVSDQPRLTGLQIELEN